MIRVFIDPTADDVLLAQNGYIDTWLNSYLAWEDEDHGPNKRPTLREPIEDSATPYYAADWRFQWSESKAELVDTLEGHIDAYADWHRILYHECTHDEGNGGPCSWDDKSQSGTVPSNVPDAEV